MRAGARCPTVRRGDEIGHRWAEKCAQPSAPPAGEPPPDAHHGKSDRHAGDMPNLRADANGVARWSWESDLLTVGAGAANVVGRSVIVHRDPDDYASQPAGNSGPRLACGLIVAAG
ncbi:MAG: superoxide dismutase family protein [Betaproteobacteria bacterium]